MTRGGARSRSGPAPSTQALARQRDGKEWTRLPAVGRTTPTPEWPAEVLDADPDEARLWARLWTMPQALVWEADRCHDLVAFYVRTYLEAMAPRAGAQARTFVRQLSNDLLLTPDALLRARYVIEGSDEDAALGSSVSRHPAGSRGHAGRPTSARDRFHVVEGTGPAPDGGDDEDDDQDDEQQPETDLGDEITERAPF